jgi:hypothetical protein
MTDATAKATRVSNDDVKAALDAVKARFALIGVDTAAWRLVNVPGEGFLVLNASDGFPSETGNRQETIATCQSFVTAFDIIWSKVGTKPADKPAEAVKAGSKVAPAKVAA